MGRFDRLPGIDDANTNRRNVVVGGMYALAGCVALGAIAGDGEDTENGNGDPESEPETETSGDDATEADTDDTAESDEETPTDEEETPTDEEDEEETAEERPEAGELSKVSQNTDWLMDGVSHSGSGQSVTDTFAASYFTTFIYEHDGSSNFIIELINDETGDTEDILVNEIGQTAGAVGIGLQDADYLLDIDADGEWNIELGEPFAPDDEWGFPPATISGEANDVYGEVEIDERVTFSGQHEGDSNFIVSVWDEANSGPFPDEIVFNEIGEFEGEASVQLSGLFYINVVADGSYRIEIE